jgi:membrane peptidoglycan carboxypeptidase
MKKKPRKRQVRRFRPGCIILLIFLATFFLSGGIMIFSPRTWQSFGDFLPAEQAKNPAIEESAPEMISSKDRLLRLIFLKRAVNSRLHYDKYVTIDHISPQMKEAIVSIEDHRFYHHHGVDWTGILRAALVNLQSGSVEEGGSTITQQLVKNLFLTHEQTFGRKAEELLLSLDMEANYSKDEILELYLNTIYYGSGYYGIASAADGYFAKAPQDLDLPEASMLAGIPNAPSLYSPYVDFIMAKKRQIIVLDAMVDNGCISRELAEEAKIKPLNLAHKQK